MRFLQYVFELLFGCVHSRTTFPMTLALQSPIDGETKRRTYVACLCCGKELTYNWDKMRIEGVSRDYSPRPLSNPAVISMKAAKIIPFAPAEQGALRYR